jgi:hypothetical protein
LGTKALSPALHLAVYLNGKVLYSNLITAEPKKHKTVMAVLRPGWNTVAFTLDHVAWQMQCSVDVVPVDGNLFEDLTLYHGDTLYDSPAFMGWGIQSSWSS